MDHIEGFFISIDFSLWLDVLQEDLGVPWGCLWLEDIEWDRNMIYYQAIWLVDTWCLSIISFSLIISRKLGYKSFIPGSPSDVLLIPYPLCNCLQSDHFFQFTVIPSIIIWSSLNILLCILLENLSFLEQSFCSFSVDSIHLLAVCRTTW